LDLLTVSNPMLMSHIALNEDRKRLLFTEQTLFTKEEDKVTSLDFLNDPVTGRRLPKAKIAQMFNSLSPAQKQLVEK